MSRVAPPVLPVNGLLAQAGTGSGGGGGLVLAVIVTIGIFALMTLLARHIRSMWQLAQTFLRPMMSAIKTLILVGLICVVVLIEMARSATGHAAIGPPAPEAAGVRPAPVLRSLT
ncbi:hypothetical protein [Pseudofrankia inefficax]|uniref:Uncharacterized protein n=1 Tax=Pseudofrankia inefficax (strain DSM 45817 / CECT 9037 / DDB 130130 / EuI1c) TaxID=298654 RepID=E3IYC0_PSEI1|nr:hypothetical protein [Pseudofrankia inefficax]ADP83865.1 hypothetical protein FraEuI1c_5881 [Pseudofrankia inefficax]